MVFYRVACPLYTTSQKGLHTSTRVCVSSSQYASEDLPSGAYLSVPWIYQSPLSSFYCEAFFSLGERRLKHRFQLFIQTCCSNVHNLELTHLNWVTNKCHAQTDKLRSSEGQKDTPKSTTNLYVQKLLHFFSKSHAFQSPSPL